MLFRKEWKDLAAGQSINFTPIKSLPYTQTHKHLILSGEAASSKQEDMLDRESQQLSMENVSASCLWGKAPRNRQI